MKASGSAGPVLNKEDSGPALASPDQRTGTKSKPADGPTLAYRDGRSHYT